MYECSEKQESKFSDQGYYKVAGRLGDLSTEFISDVRLDQGLQNVKFKVSMFQGKFNLRIVSIG